MSILMWMAAKKGIFGIVQFCVTISVLPHFWSWRSWHFISY